VAVVSKKAEAEKKRGNKTEAAVGAESAGVKARAVKAGKKKSASKKAAGKKAASKKTSNKKTAGKKAASKKSSASKDRVSAKTKITKKVSTTAKDAAPAAGALERDPFEVAKQTMKGSVTAIVEAMVAQAKKGSCSHAKTLLEMTGAKHMFGDEAEMADSGEPWAKLVLERMDAAEQESLTERLTQDLPDFAVE
jgi:hypothetical protein